MLTPITSSMITALGYNQPTGTLEVAFANTRRYRYEGVPAEVYDELLAATSKGRFMLSRIIGTYAAFEVLGKDCR